MAVKVSMLAAMGAGEWLNSEGQPAVRAIEITQRDAEVGILMARRWAEAALRFAQSVGGFDPHERRFQQRCAKAFAFVKRQGRCTRADVMRRMRVASDELDRIQLQLVGLGQITVKQAESTGGRPALIWELSGNNVR